MIDNPTEVLVVLAWKYMDYNVSPACLFESIFGELMIPEEDLKKPLNQLKGNIIVIWRSDLEAP